ncbi:FG-GAP repeat domain-containing protein [Aquihabitans sp. McL0605]|uniref:FG-GAP repeat domain-containing protein n=1 Tax=Aquihabitans sp. McL0605 TaxID=3415671 RepID=UPI003CFA2867
MFKVTSTRRRVASIAVAAAATIAVCGIGSGPASADTPPSGRLIVLPTAPGPSTMIRDHAASTLAIGSGAEAFAGTFSSATGADLLVYSPGAGTDYIAHMSNSIPATATFTTFTVTNSYIPVIGDFDGNGIDDILWYAPGSGADKLWLFTGATAHTSVAVSISGSYRPTVLDADGDSRDDILWYSSSGADSLWLFGSGATSHVSKAITAGPGYQIVAGHFGLPAAGQPQDRVVFYNPSGNDYFWTFDTHGNHTSALLPAIDGSYKLLPGQFFEETYGGLVFYGPGSLPEKEWAFGPGPGGDVAPEDDIPAIAGTYTTQVGDFDGNGFTDIAFTSGTTTTVWNFTDSGSHTQNVFTGLPSGALVRPVTQH